MTRCTVTCSPAVVVVVQVPLATINMHLGGVDCRSLSPGVDAQHVDSSTHSQDFDTHPSKSNNGLAAPQTHTPTLLQHIEPKSDVQVTEHNDKGALSSTHQPASTSGFANTPYPLQLQVTPLLQSLSACTGPTGTDTQVHSIAPADVSLLPKLPGPEQQVQHVPVPHSNLLGEYIIASFVSAAEESALIRFVDTISPPWKDTTFNGRHRGKRWGAEMDLGRRTVQQGNIPLPVELSVLVQRMQSMALLRDFRPNEANAIDYCKSKGHWLKKHVDDRQLSTNKIVTLSLGCAATMTFSCSKRKHEVAVRLPACALQTAA